MAVNIDVFIEELSEHNALNYKWIIRNRHKLAGTTKVRLPSGERVEWYIHTMCRYVNKEVLKGNEHTAFGTVWRAVLPKIIEDIEAFMKDKVDFQPLPMLPNTPEFKEVKWIENSCELKIEGRTMNHCVGSYILACREGRSHIFHVDDGTSLGCTVELTGDPKKGFQVNQSYGHSNNHSEKGKEIMEEYLKHIDLEQLAKREGYDYDY